MRTAALMIAIGVGGALALAGWKSRVPSFDMIPHYADAAALASDGAVPAGGCLSSFGARIPPGTTWLIAPGFAAGLESRLVEYPGAFFLFVVTILGVYFLARESFGPAAAVWAALVYAASDRGIFFASSLWPRGHPAFAVWFACFLAQWVKTGRGVWLGAALATLFAGLYVFLELLPLALALPFVWLRWRPRLSLPAIALAAAVGAAVWWPYLAQQSRVGFQDLRALLSRRALPTPDVAPLLADPNQQIKGEAGNVLWPAASGEAKPPVPPSRPALLWIGLSENFGPASWWRTGLWLVALGAGLFASGRTSAGGVAARCLFVPWLLLLLMPEHDLNLAGRRYWWLMPLQSVMASGSIALAGPRLGVAIGAVLLAATASRGLPAQRAVDAFQSGFAGADAPAWRAMQHVANRAHARGLAAPKIGYRIPIWGHVFLFAPLDPRYKLGWEWDFVLARDFGVRNRSRAPEGIENDCDFVIEDSSATARFKFAPAAHPSGEFVAGPIRVREYGPPAKRGATPLAPDP
ncbi:MAG TPA: hypothetical protein VNC50_06570 [Planctomycetia bacterium]|nr:hypothetical protein [Planctomycetia bacterium]